jgi:alkanesulfonate monooxygenase SsuD/methylene tetrahydromethanopterin reductase-like flavin-dependent oxidoreductase (luciferase family)
MKPFRFGVVVGQTRDLTSWTGLAKRVEDLGFDTFLATDPVFDLDPLTLLSAAAAATTTLHVGTFVLADPFRDRRLLAWQSDSLHRVTGGRFELGLGTGRPGADERSIALTGEFGGNRERLARLTETVDHLAQHPGPPLLLAGSGPRMLSLAARAADIVTFSWNPRTTEPVAKSIVDNFRELAGSRIDDIELSANLMAVGEKSSPQAAKWLGIDVPELAAMGAVTVLPEDPERAADTLRRWRETLGISYITVNSGYVDQLSRVVPLLKGS